MKRSTHSGFSNPSPSPTPIQSPRPRSSINYLDSSSINDLIRAEARHQHERNMRHRPPTPLVPPSPRILDRPCVSPRIQEPPHGPRQPQTRRDLRVREPGNQQANEERGVVVPEVGVRPLRAVEAVRRDVLLGFRRGRVGVRVGDFRRFAEFYRQFAVVDGDEGGGAGGGEDIAIFFVEGDVSRKLALGRTGGRRKKRKSMHDCLQSLKVSPS